MLLTESGAVKCDPESAHALLSNPVLMPKTTLIPLDLTHQVLATQEVQELLLHGPEASRDPNLPPSTLRHLKHDLLTFFASTYADIFGLTAGPPLHDPVAVAVLLGGRDQDDVMFDDGAGERWIVDVTTEGRHGDFTAQTGRTVARRAEPGEAGVRIPRSLDVSRFWSMLERCLAGAEAHVEAQVDDKSAEMSDIARVE